MGEVGGLDTGVLDIAIACIVICWAWEGKNKSSNKTEEEQTDSSDGGMEGLP